MVWIIILAFAISSSIDNLAVGITYGIRGIGVGKRENILIAGICFLMSFASIMLGIWLTTVLPGKVPIIMGAFLLFVIGIRIILLTNPKKKENSVQVEQLNNNKEILFHPEMADVDKSGHIGWKESVFLGVALSANALTNGLGAGLLGFSPLAISLAAAIGSYFSIWAGVRLGIKLAAIRIGKFTVGRFGTLLSGLIIVIIAIVAFF